MSLCYLEGITGRSGRWKSHRPCEGFGLYHESGCPWSLGLGDGRPRMLRCNLSPAGPIPGALSTMDARFMVFWVCRWKQAFRRASRRKGNLQRGAEGRKNGFSIWEPGEMLAGQRSVHFDLWGDETPWVGEEEKPQRSTVNLWVCKGLFKSVWGYQVQKLCLLQILLVEKEIFTATFLKSEWQETGFFFSSALLSPPPPFPPHPHWGWGRGPWAIYSE